MTASMLCGVFVGGASRRMGGTPKGLLRAPGDVEETLVARLVRVAREVGCEPVLVGDARAYLGVAGGVTVVRDQPEGVGPLGGLHALLLAAGEHDAVALGCDMPFVSPAALALLCHAVIEPEADVIAARAEDQAPWEGLFARYRSGRVMAALEQSLAAGERSFQRLFCRLNVQQLALPPELRTALEDWDTPDDVRAGPRGVARR